MKILAVLAVLVLGACNSSSPTAPTLPTSPPIANVPSAPTITVSGIVLGIPTRTPLGGVTATIEFNDQSTTTNASGVYSLTFTPRSGVPTTTIRLSSPLILSQSFEVSNVSGAISTHEVVSLASPFDLGFYRKLVHNAFEGPSVAIARFSQAPRIYLRTVDDDGRQVDPLTLDQTAAALINAAGEMTGAFGLAGLEQGVGHRLGQAGWLTVRWVPQAGNPLRVCGFASVGREGGTLELFPYQANCGCGRFRMAPRIVKHELGHALGFWHTDSVNDLMWGSTWPISQCEMGMSAREKYHAAVAYTRPIGSPSP